MSKWSSLRREVAPRSKRSDLMPQPDTRLFTSDEIRVQRLELAQDMVRLVLKDDAQALPAPIRHELQTLYEAVGKLRRRTQTLS